MASGTSLYYGHDKPIGITSLGELDDPEADYSFDILFVFKDDASNRVFYGRDSGCSCPSPFEDFTWDGPDKNSFTEVTKANFESFINVLWAEYYRGYYTDEKREIENKVKKVLNVWHAR